ncbi:hypothetical protein F2Q68_00034289 [Brassica cretica]|uniref:Uncharacterized protein n=1 Tax=Brassica cretica TaxID=69181 RepID=A0A8S9H6H1_BRACR|nr:hypothetical protein F2Q68_00034289 [Brassica cretica]
MEEYAPDMGQDIKNVSHFQLLGWSNQLRRSNWLAQLVPVSVLLRSSRIVPVQLIQDSASPNHLSIQLIQDSISPAHLRYSAIPAQICKCYFDSAQPDRPTPSIGVASTKMYPRVPSIGLHPQSCIHGVASTH